MFETIVVFQLLGVYDKAASAQYQSVGFFTSKQLADDVVKESQGSSSPIIRSKVEERHAIRGVEAPHKSYLIGDAIIVADNLQELRFKAALAKLTPEEIKLLQSSGLVLK